MTTSRAYAAHRLHQFRVEARLTCDEVDEKMGWTPKTCQNIEYGRGGTVKKIQTAIDRFVPGQRRMD